MNLIVLALANGPGAKLQESVGEEIGSLFLLAVIGFSLMFFYKRQFTQFIGFILFAMLVSVFIFRPELIQSLGTDSFTWLFEAYLQ